MKKTIVAIAIALLMLMATTPALAGDPPDTDVDVTVVSPGDVDLDVDIVAGGDVNVTVDGYDMDAMASQISSLYAGLSGLSYQITNDWYRLFGKEMASYDQLLVDINNTLEMLSAAEAMLIEGQRLTTAELTTLNQALKSLVDDINSRDTEVSGELLEIRGLIEGIQRQIQDHLSLLDGAVLEHEATLIRLQQRVNSLSDELSAVGTEILTLRSENSQIQERYSYYFYGLGGAVIILTLAVIVTWILRKGRVVP